MNIHSLKEQVPNLEVSSEFGIFTQHLLAAHLLCAEHCCKISVVCDSTAKETMIQHFNFNLKTFRKITSFKAALHKIHYSS